MSGPVTGRAPVSEDTATDARRPDLATILRKVQQGDFPGPRQVNPGVNPALEAICLKAMALKPEDRYPSPSALIDDLKHWLAGEPVSAWPEPWTVKLRRWARRHRTLVSSAAAVLLVTTIGSLAGFAMIAQVNRELDRQNQALDVANGQLEQRNKALDASQKVAKARLDQSLKALGLFATDFRVFCEDALVPGERKVKLYERLIEQIEGQIAQEPDEPLEASDDAFRNRVWMYQTVAIVYLDTQKREKARATIAKGLRDTTAWLKLKPDDPYALSFRAAFLSLSGDLQTDPAAARAAYLDVLKLRRELAGKPGVDRFTPGRSFMQLADTLDKLHQFDESLNLREQTCTIQLEKGVDADRLFESFDFWTWTCWKAYLDTGDEARKQALLEKADELSKRTLKIRPGARRTLERWSGISRELGDQAYNRAKRAEIKKQPGLARQYAAAALKYYEQLADISRQLAVAPDLLYSFSNYGRSFYALGVMRKNLGKPEEARASLAKSRHVREQLMRDFAGNPYAAHLEIDLLFTRVAQGEHAEVVRAADAMRRQPQFQPAQAQSLLYRLACIYSLSAEAVEEARRPNALTDEDKKLQAEYRDKALTVLEQSHANGNRDYRTTRMDADLNAIREDPRFAKILQLEKKQSK